MTSLSRFLIVAVAFPFALFCQLEPESAHVNLYFPHLADGGPAEQQWQTSFVFTNSHPQSAVSVVLRLYNNSGGPLYLDLGAGYRSILEFSIPPSGTKVLRSLMASPTMVTGWAIAYASLPLQATVLFRAIERGAHKVEISATATLPSWRYRSSATKSLGIAVANVYSNVSVPLTVIARDPDGTELARGATEVGPLAHSSFNLSAVCPSLPDNYVGSIEINSGSTRYQFAAWTLNSDRGLLASLPPGALSWPISHWDRIWLVYRKVLKAAELALPGTVSLYDPPIIFNISHDKVVNAWARSGTTIQINLALSELISDSPSELAFVVAHELAHIVQVRTGRLTFDPYNPERDADQWAMLFCLAAGYDPYAGAGALAKLSMATGSSGLVDQFFDDLTDVHGSFSTRITAMYSLLQAICAHPQYRDFCAEYKSVIHPDFPPGVPLSTRDLPRQGR